MLIITYSRYRNHTLYSLASFTYS